MSYTSQLVGLVVQNFLAGGGGAALGLAFFPRVSPPPPRAPGDFLGGPGARVVWGVPPGGRVGPPVVGGARAGSPRSPSSSAQGNRIWRGRRCALASAARSSRR